MTHDPHALVEISDCDLSHVTGGFLPLLGLLGPIADIAGQIMGGIGKKKSQEAQQLAAQTQGASGQGSADASGGAPAAAAAGTNLMPQQQQSAG